MSSLLMTRSRGTWGNFNRFWASQSFAQMAGQVLYFGLPLLAASSLGLSASAVGLVTFFQFLPTIIFTPLAGLLVDRLDRRKALLVCHGARSVVLVLITCWWVLDPASMSSVWLVALACGSLNAVADIATLAIIPEVAPKDQLSSANSRIQTSLAVAQVAGPSASGFMVGLGTFSLPVGAGLAFLFALGIGLGFTVPQRVDAAGASGSTGTMPGSAITQLRDAVRIVVRHRLLRALIIQMGLFNLFEQAVITLFMLYGLREFGLSASGVGSILSLGAVGALVGSLLAPRLMRRLDRGTVLAVTMGLASLPPILLPMLSSAPSLVAGVVSAGVFLTYGWGLTAFNVASITTRHELISHGEQGRTSAFYRLVAYGALSLGAGLASGLTAVLTLRDALVVAVVGLVVSYLGFVCQVLGGWRRPSRRGSSIRRVRREGVVPDR
ncbi:MFS transporter [Streptomyces demainii]|uniref:MFS family permease n=1 Tax=Streptomyces demainii TaxID=588122 RepID=A0ABT9KZN1_9ACTN|nr:MFS transporter [Streptomyces demainii]MDP9612937.1 MFS family permease [Streptomyces demainii]